jgi:hypothetical protein
MSSTSGTFEAGSARVDSRSLAHVSDVRIDIETRVVWADVA